MLERCKPVKRQLEGSFQDDDEEEEEEEESPIMPSLVLCGLSAYRCVCPSPLLVRSWWCWYCQLWTRNRGAVAIELQALADGSTPNAAMPSTSSNTPSDMLCCTVTASLFVSVIVALVRALLLLPVTVMVTVVQSFVACWVACLIPGLPGRKDTIKAVCWLLCLFSLLLSRTIDRSMI